MISDRPPETEIAATPKPQVLEVPGVNKACNLVLISLSGSPDLPCRSGVEEVVPSHE